MAFHKVKIFLLVASIWITAAGFISPASKIYAKAVRFAKKDQKHFAYMQYNNLLRNYPSSRYRAEALFATGEYYYQNSSFESAARAFTAFLEENPQSAEKIYALAYLLNLSEHNKIERPPEELKRAIIDLHQVSFVFRDQKENTYRSPLYQHYKTIIQIDQIEFYVEGDLFAKVSF